MTAGLVMHTGTAPSHVIDRISASVLSGLLDPRLTDAAALELVGVGRGIAGGDAAGILVLGRDVAHALIDRAAGMPFVYSMYDGGAADFEAVRACQGFFTPNPARTTFLPVQAVTDGKPTVIDVGAEYIVEPGTIIRRTFQTGSATTLELDLPYRAIRFVGPDGVTHIVEEGARLVISAASGRVFQGEAELITSSVARVYELLLDCYMTAASTFGWAEAWSHLSENRTFEAHADELLALLHGQSFQDFQDGLVAARTLSPLSVHSTAHTPCDVAKARLFASTVEIDVAGRVAVTTDDGAFGIGLIRDERMWVAPDDIELLQLLLLGSDVVGVSRTDALAKRYREVHGARFAEVFAVGTGCSATVRIPCMPANKIFPADFPVAKFAVRHDLDSAAVEHAVSRMANESEAYHGCRGMRLLAQRRDLAELWLETVLGAARMVAERGVPLRLRLLLAMTTLPSEVEAFLDVFDAVAPRLLGEDLKRIVEGISVMLETAGAYILLEDIWSLRSQYVAVNGGLVGSNDFTAACLNFNRSDTPRTTIPGYIARGLLKASPFHTLETRLVGRAILGALRRVQRLSHRDGSDYFWGLGGELAGEWDSVQWLAREAAPRGLQFVTTTPDQMPVALLAAAQAVLDDDIGAGAAVA